MYKWIDKEQQLSPMHMHMHNKMEGGLLDVLQVKGCELIVTINHNENKAK